MTAMFDRVELERALRHDELRLRYQPIVSLSSDRVTAAEALLVWQHPQLGLIGPEELLAAADAAGLLHELGRWVIDSAVAERARWPAGVLLSINLSPEQLVPADGHDAVVDLLDACRRHGTSPADLWVEVTERTMGDEQGIGRALHRLASEDVRLAVDDFGTGYASLGRLRAWPFSVCKLAQALVEDIDVCEQARDVVRATTQLAHALGTVVVAEGIERPSQLSVLRDLGCDFGQGFHLHHPMPAASLRVLLTQQEATTCPPARLEAGSSHHVGFHRDDEELTQLVATELRGPLASGATVALIATPQHLSRIEVALARDGVDVGAARAAGRLRTMDAEVVAAEVVHDGRVARHRFLRLIDELLDPPGDGRRPVHVYGEVVAVLAGLGQVEQALALEDLWNEVALMRTLHLLCAYRLGDLATPEGRATFDDICVRHDHVASPVRGGQPAVPPSRSPDTARLEHEVELARLAAVCERPHVGAVETRSAAGGLAVNDGPVGDLLHELRNAAAIVGLGLTSLGLDVSAMGPSRPHEALERMSAGHQRLVRALEKMAALTKDPSASSTSAAADSAGAATNGTVGSATSGIAASAAGGRAARATGSATPDGARGGRHRGHLTLITGHCPRS